MKEGQSKCLTFPDISVKDWERMMNYVTLPVWSRALTFRHALRLVVLYDKYDFHTGVELCDDKLEDIFFGSDDKEISIDQKVNTVILGESIVGLEETRDSAVRWVNHLIGDVRAVKMDLTVDHVKSLVPILVKHDVLCEAVKELIGVEAKDITCPLFPALFVSQFQLIAARNTAHNIVNLVQVTNCDEAGIYKASGSGVIDDSCSFRYFGDQRGWLEIRKREGENWELIKWVPVPSAPGDSILTVDGMTLYICEGSRFAVLPPRTGWKIKVRRSSFSGRLSETARKIAVPKLRYFWEHGDEKVEFKGDF